LQRRAEYEAAAAALADLGAVGLITDLAVFLRRGWLGDAIPCAASIAIAGARYGSSGSDRRSVHSPIFRARVSPEDRDRAERKVA
jgi:hypothetical protein